MFWVISLAYGIAVLAIASALALGIIWSVERFAKRGVRSHHWRAMHTWWGWESLLPLNPYPFVLYMVKYTFGT